MRTYPGTKPGCFGHSRLGIPEHLHEYDQNNPVWYPSNAVPIYPIDKLTYNSTRSTSAVISASANACSCSCPPPALSPGLDPNTLLDVGTPGQLSCCCFVRRRQRHTSSRYITIPHAITRCVTYCTLSHAIFYYRALS